MPCATHARKPDFRPRRQARGYDAKYETAKKTPEFRKATRCETCGKKFTPENPKTGGHRKDIRAGGSTEDGIFPQCRRCNYGWRRAQEA